MKKFVILTGVLALAACTPLAQADNKAADKQEIEKQKASCLESVKNYMSADDAEHFCGQPEWCRKWWDDLTEVEKREMQPPKWRKSTNDMDTCMR